MNDSSLGISFFVPYEIAVVRPLRQTTLQERQSVLQAAGYNSELLPQEMIYIDLCTDSGVSALSTAPIYFGLPCRRASTCRVIWTTWRKRCSMRTRTAMRSEDSSRSKIPNDPSTNLPISHRYERPNSTAHSATSALHLGQIFFTEPATLANAPLSEYKEAEASKRSPGAISA